MPLTHLRTFRVRHHECDLHGVARDATCLRFMQETAFDASAAAGYDRARYLAMNRLWLVRETQVEFLSPLRYGDTVQVKTWVEDFRRVRSRRAYELRHAGSTVLVAQGFTDWVFLNLGSSRPAAIPPELIAAFSPEGMPATAPPRPRFPAQPPPPAGLFTSHRKVEWRDLDAAGHVNNAAYADYLEDAARQALAGCGWPTARWTAAGLALATRTLHLEYRQPILPDDEMAIMTWLSDLAPRQGTRHTQITRQADGELLAQARATWGCVHAQTREPTAIPQQLLADLRPHNPA